MTQSPPQVTPRITPYLLYEDAAAAIEWLSSAFGFRERYRIADADGTVTHAELELGDGLVMLGHPGPAYRNPKSLGQTTQLVHVYVDDVDAHFARAVAAGATIVCAPADQSYGDRRYDVEDPEGHRWSFAQALPGGGGSD
jgi:PhnB protein